MRIEQSSVLLLVQRAILLRTPSTFGGLTYRLIDTAGIRDTEDYVEQIGIQKAFEQAEKADVIFYLIDATAAEDDLELRLAHLKTSAPQAHLFVCINKSDQGSYSADRSAVEPDRLRNLCYCCKK